MRAQSFIAFKSYVDTLPSFHSSPPFIHPYPASRTPKPLPSSSYHPCETVSLCRHLILPSPPSPPTQPPRQKNEETHTQAQNAYISSTPAAPCTCTPCTRASAQSSSSSWLSCGRPVWSGRRIRIVCDRNGVSLAPRWRPRRAGNISTHAQSHSQNKGSWTEGKVEEGRGRRRDVGWDGKGKEEGGGTHLAGLVLCDFVLGMLLAFLTLAVGASCFGYVDLESQRDISTESNQHHASLYVMLFPPPQDHCPPGR